MVFSLVTIGFAKTWELQTMLVMNKTEESAGHFASFVWRYSKWTCSTVGATLQLQKPVTVLRI